MCDNFNTRRCCLLDWWDPDICLAFRRNERKSLNYSEILTITDKSKYTFQQNICIKMPINLIHFEQCQFSDAYRDKHGFTLPIVNFYTCIYGSIHAFGLSISCYETSIYKLSSMCTWQSAWTEKKYKTKNGKKDKEKV